MYCWNHAEIKHNNEGNKNKNSMAPSKSKTQVPPKSTAQVRYQYPNWLFIPVVLIIGCMTDLAFNHGPDFSHDAKLYKEGTWQYYYYLVILQTLKILAVQIFGNFEYFMYVTVAAHFAHVAESFYCAIQCARYDVPFLTMVKYVIGTSLGGTTQLSPMHKEMDRFEIVKNQ